MKTSFEERRDAVRAEYWWTKWGSKLKHGRTKSLKERLKLRIYNHGCSYPGALPECPECALWKECLENLSA